MSATARSWILILATTIPALFVVYGRVYLPRDAEMLMGRHDLWAYFGPTAHFMDASVDAGETPLWNPLVFCGTPYAANPQASVFYPPHLIRSLLNFGSTPFATHVSLVWMVMAHFVLLSAGTFFLCRDHGLTRTASLAAALCFVFSANLVMRVPQHWHFIAAIAWAPFILLLIRKGIREESVVRLFGWFTGAGVLFGVTLLAGFPQQAIYTGIMIAGYTAGYSYLARGESKKFQICHGLALVLAVVVAAGVAVPLLIPAYEFSAYAERSKAIGEAYLEPGFPVSPGYFVRGFVEYGGVTWPGSTGIRMLGAVGLLLALMAAFHSRIRRDAAICVALFLVFIDCSLGPPMPVATLVDRLAPFRIENPARATTYACFFMALLAGFGVDAVAGKRWIRIRAVPTGFVVVMGLAIVLLLASYLWPAPYLPISRLVVLVPAAAVMVAALGTFKKGAKWAAPALVGLLFLEQLSWSGVLLRYVVKTEPYPGDVDILHHDDLFSTVNARVVSPYLRENESMYRLEPAITGYDPLYLADVRHALLRRIARPTYNRRLTHEDPTRFNQRGNMLLSRRFWLSKQCVVGEWPDRSSLYPVATTAFVDRTTGVPVVSAEAVQKSPVSELTRTHAVDLELIGGENDEGRGVTYRLAWEAPDGYSALRIEIEADEAALVNPTFRDDKNEMHRWGHSYSIIPYGWPLNLWLPIPGGRFTSCHIEFQGIVEPKNIRIKSVQVVEDLGDEAGLIDIAEVSANRARVTVGPLDGPRILTYVDANYPGWRVEVDGMPAPLLQSADHFKAVELEAGTHRVEFIFEPKTVKTGLAIGIATLIVCSILGGAMLTTRLKGGK